MKLALIVSLLLQLVPVAAEDDPFARGAGEDAPKKLDWGNFYDPRQGFLYEWIEDGKRKEKTRGISHSILIICWHPAPNGELGITYQIGGVPGYHDFGHVERFLSALYDMEHQIGQSKVPLNVVVAGNNYAAGEELATKLAELSKEKKFSAFYAGGWAFRRAILVDEPKPRLKLILAANKLAANNKGQDDADQPAAERKERQDPLLELLDDPFSGLDDANEAEQADADQPATAAGSESEGEKEAKPESEERSQ
jgi:hypothetical protein